MTFAIQRDMLSGGKGVAAPSPPPDLVMLVKPTAGEGKLDPEFSCEGKTGCECTAEKERMLEVRVGHAARGMPRNRPSDARCAGGGGGGSVGDFTS